MIASWPSYLLGLATLPAIAVAVILVLSLTARTGSRATRCDVCAWSFAGLRANTHRLGHVPDGELNHPFEVHALLSEWWHDAVVMRTRAHRAAWTSRFEDSSNFRRERMLPHARRNGSKGHLHELKEEWQ